MIPVEFLICTHAGHRPLLLEQKELLLEEEASYRISNQYRDENEKYVGDPQAQDFNDVGLSRNRNHCLELARGPLCVFADNDVSLAIGALSAIRQAYQELPDADLITFELHHGLGHPIRSYPREIRRHNRMSAFKVKEMEITFKLESIKRAGLRFDERFGLGAKYPSGEGFLFLSQCLDRGLKLYSYPHPLFLHAENSSGSNFSDLAQLKSKGALFRKTFGSLLSLPMGMAFLAKKRHLIRPHHSWPTAWRAYLQGYREMGN